jgi:uncharacterized SAM-binding protein YcdF (DUF218 family)
VWIAVAASLLLIAGKRRAGSALAILSALMLILMGVVPSAIWLLRPLEFRYVRAAQPLDAVKGILILGGGETNRARLMGGYTLARQYPSAVVVYSGGSNRLIGPQDDVDAMRAKTMLLNMGLSPARLIVENRSRNTWENILFSRDLVKPAPGGTWILATSAVQMPRAMGVAKALDWTFTPWPTDWHTGQHVFSGYFLVPLNLGLFDEAVREWIGLLAYRLTGKAK